LCSFESLSIELAEFKTAKEVTEKSWQANGSQDRPGEIRLGNSGPGKAERRKEEFN